MCFLALLIGEATGKGPQVRLRGPIHQQSYCAAALITIFQTLPVQRENVNMLGLPWDT